MSSQSAGSTSANSAKFETKLYRAVDNWYAPSPSGLRSPRQLAFSSSILTSNEPTLLRAARGRTDVNVAPLSRMRCGSGRVNNTLVQGAWHEGGIKQVQRKPLRVFRPGSRFNPPICAMNFSESNFLSCCLRTCHERCQLPTRSTQATIVLAQKLLRHQTDIGSTNGRKHFPADQVCRISLREFPTHSAEGQSLVWRSIRPSPWKITPAALCPFVAESSCQT